MKRMIEIDRFIHKIPDLSIKYDYLTLNRFS